MKLPIGLPRPRLTVALLFLVTLISLLVVSSPRTATAQTALTQCNGAPFDGAGLAIECHYTVTNTIKGSATSSTVQVQECHGQANNAPTLVCTSKTTKSSDLVTSISQCNNTGNGGGGTMVCTVDVVNKITGTVKPTPATVNQCNGSGGGGGANPLLCNPYPASTSGATVTQCNGSANGGGGTGRVKCTVDSGSTTTSVLGVTVNQCNDSENLGGSTVTCRTSLTDRVTAAGGGPTGPDDDDDDDDDTTGGSGGPPDDDVTTDTTTATPDDDQTTTTTSQVTRVPEGGASTGGGSTSGIEHAGLLALGLGLVAAAGVVVTVGQKAHGRS